MKTNYYQGQINGPFLAGEEIFNKISAEAVAPCDFISHIGIQTFPQKEVLINGKLIEISKAGIYEIGNTEITSIKFQQDVDKNTIIDFTIEYII